MEYLGLIIAICVGCITIVSMVMVLFLWIRAEARSDARHTDSKLESTRELVRAIHEEVKGFHAKLYAIEERRLKK